MASTAISTDDGVEEIFLSLFSSLSKVQTSSLAASNVSTNIQSLEDKLDGPKGVIHFLLPRVWISTTDDASKTVYGDDALTILTHLVETRPTEYMAPTASAVRNDIEHNFNTNEMVVETDEQSNKMVSDALILALSKLLIGPNSDNQVGIASDAQFALISLCRYDADQNHRDTIAKRVLSTADTLWYHLEQQEDKRASSISQMRIGALMVDICLLGGDEMSLALSIGIMDKLLHIGLDHPNDDPLLQISALDQLERLTIHNEKYPLSSPRVDFLLGNDILRRGLLCLVGCPGNLAEDATVNDDEWEEPDPINGGAALRLLTEICKVGVLSSSTICEESREKFQLLLSSFQRSLHNFHPQGELERLSYIYAVSSLVGSCAMGASSSSSTSDVAKTILNDTTLLHEWLSLHSRVSQPKLKATVLSSLSQVIEPSMWQDGSSSESYDLSRPADSIVLQLYMELSRANNKTDSTELILASAKSPFLEERLGAYDILRALVMRGVVVRLLLLYDDGTGNGRCSSFLEWLLNQDTESISEGKKAKYQVAMALLNSNTDMLGGLISARELRQLEEWKRGGPNYYSTTTVEMATE